MTDGQTDGQTDRIAIASIALVMRALRGAVKMQFSAHMEENALSVHPASGFTQTAGAAVKNGGCGVVIPSFLVPIYGPVGSVRCFDGPLKRSS